MHSFRVSFRSANTRSGTCNEPMLLLKPTESWPLWASDQKPSRTGTTLPGISYPSRADPVHGVLYVDTCVLSAVDFESRECVRCRYREVGAVFRAA